MSDSIARRLDYQARIEERGAQDLELALCSRDIIHWVGAWLWTFDPRLPQASIPFDLFPRQVEFLLWLRAREEAREDGLVEKSRDMGVTYLCCAYALHGWLFRDGFAAGFGSRKLELVDRRGDPDTIFEKVRFLLANLPRWMLPRGFRPDEHDNLARLVNPANGASITGEGGDQIGRGGRKSLYVVDEAAFLEHPDLIERSLSQTTNVRLDVSTPNGPGNPFARKRFSGTVPVFTLHWKNDPRKNHTETRPDGTTVYPWYEEQKKKLDPVTLAQEIEIDYTASVEGICVPAKWVRAAVGLELPESGPVVGGLDVADLGVNRNALVTRRGPVVRRVSTWAGCNTTETAWRARDEAQADGAQSVSYDANGVGAGVRGAWGSAEAPLPFAAHAVNTGESPTDAVWPDGRTSHEKFLNLRAELWWKARSRFEKAYEYRELGVKHPPEEMISIPDDPELVAQLSLPLYQRTATGKIKVESKQDMRRRGVKSPDVADAFVLTLHDPPRNIFRRQDLDALRDDTAPGRWED